MTPRCGWCGSDPLYLDYHDLEWGVPVHDDRRLFEMLTLEGAQAGLSWLTILRKRDGYRQAFDELDPERIARYSDADIQRLLGDAGIVRNRLKIASVVRNAQGVLTILEDTGSLDAFLWQFVDHMPQQNAWRSLDQVPSQTPASDRMSKALKKRGFSFVGSTICYAFMQAVGMVNDHVVGCYRHAEIARLGDASGDPTAR
ncbi:DNA-3-methyladenine glycosylase I [Thiocapsa roseopersicina]|uniref:DNA-3-methyladenine glycosylase I n=1 Tax=Thiocapsa roseopersicina TaxID=1058 RepID=A0A1H2UPG6_THIRO|nr:DNA-3-methyladenine glycosylase I [Thiocapsa roseopersicina]SDW58043.1 DNA-3-methyladenine glycosylase I [Thiocapsa roseopersicina]